jgi:hypothetical protein
MSVAAAWEGTPIENPPPHHPTDGRYGICRAWFFSNPATTAGFAMTTQKTVPFPANEWSQAHRNYVMKTRQQNLPWYRNIPWHGVEAIAQVVTALCALGALGYAIHQNRETAALLAHARDAFSVQSFPVVKQDGRFDWNVNPGQQLSCSTPPSGISVYFRNFSGVPVALEESTVKLFHGERGLLGNPAIRYGPGGESILPPGVSVSVVQGGKDFSEVYTRLTEHPPYLNFELIIIYRSLITGERYRYTGKAHIHHTCRTQATTLFTGDDKIAKLSPP